MPLCGAEHDFNNLLASKQPLRPAIVDLWALVERLSPLLRHALGQRVNFDLQPPGVLVSVRVDAAGLEAVLLNLMVNARDAMPRGGDLSLCLEGLGLPLVWAATQTGLAVAGGTGAGLFCRRCAHAAGGPVL